MNSWKNPLTWTLEEQCLYLHMEMKNILYKAQAIDDRL